MSHLRLILLRHGESEWNALNLFTGWVDVRLSAKGEAEAKRGGIDVLFLGDSITDFWRDPNRGLAVWQRNYAPLHAANFGISADRTQHLLWRLEHGEVDALACRQRLAQELDDGHTGNLLRVLEGKEHAGLGAHVGGPVGDVGANAHTVMTGIRHVF